MQSLRSLRRLALGAAIAGSAVGALPALASAAPIQSCSYSPSLHQVFAVDNSGAAELVIGLSGLSITVGDGFTEPVVCENSSDLEPPTEATILNTDKITVGGNGKLTGPSDGYVIDERSGPFGPGWTPEADGNSEIEIEIQTSIPTRLTVEGTRSTALPDVIRVGRTPGGVNAVNFGSDSDIDAVITGGITHVTVNAGDGDDFITAGGNADQTTMARATVPVDFLGQIGNDVLVGGDARDNLSGEQNNDFFISGNGDIDTLSGGSGTDAATIDVADKRTGIEKLELFGVGRLGLAPKTLRARAGKTAHLRMSWTHPKAWRDLRTVKLRLYDGGKPVGTIDVRPRGKRLTAAGAISLAAGSRVTHHGKTVTAKLAVRLPRSLAGHNLRVAVHATDRHGHEQLEPDAGAIRVAE
jgi:hypothetical protein